MKGSKMFEGEKSQRQKSGMGCPNFQNHGGEGYGPHISMAPTQWGS